MIVFHHDPEYLADVKSLERYIQEELNVFEITLTSDEAQVGIKYKATADWGKLGKKLRKDIGRVKAGLPDLTSEEVKEYETSGKIAIDGIELGPGDLIVSRYVDLDPATDGEKSFDSNTDSDVTVLLDIRIHPELEVHAQRRELTNRCQQLRKRAGLKATDSVDIFFEVIEGSPEVMHGIMEGQEETFTRKLGAVPCLLPPGAKEQRKFLGQEETKVANGDNDAAEVDEKDVNLSYVLYVAERM